MFKATKDPTNEPHFLAILAFADRRPANWASAQFSSDYYFSQFCGLAGLSWVVLMFHVVSARAKLELVQLRWLNAHD